MLHVEHVMKMMYVAETRSLDMLSGYAERKLTKGNGVDVGWVTGRIHAP
jgi:hypothetical protein